MEIMEKTNVVHVPGRLFSMTWRVKKLLESNITSRYNLEDLMPHDAAYVYHDFENEFRPG